MTLACLYMTGHYEDTHETGAAQVPKLIPHTYQRLLACYKAG
jgi:hypothetical protein